MEKRTLTWPFGGASDSALGMRWSTQTGPDRHRSDFRLELEGMLAPLFFVWSSDGEYDEIDDVWSTAWTPTRSGAPAPAAAPFLVRFSRKLPVRPLNQPTL